MGRSISGSYLVVHIKSMDPYQIDSIPKASDVMFGLFFLSLIPAQTSKFWNDHFRGKLHDASIPEKIGGLNVEPQPPALMFRMPRSCKEGVPESVNVFWLKFNQLGSGCPETTPNSRMGMD